MNPAGSFLVEKCFTASNFSHKEATVAELLAARSELSKTRHGFHLLKKLDVDRYARRPEQWRASQTSKETILRQFEVEFGSNSKSVAQNFEEKFLSQNPSKKSKQGKSDKITKDASCNKLARESTSMAFLKDSGKRKSPGFLSDKPILKKQKHHRPTSGKPDDKRFGQSSSSSMPFVKNTGKPKQSIVDLADLAGKEKLTAAEVHKLLKPKMSKS